MRIGVPQIGIPVGRAAGSSPVLDLDFRSALPSGWSLTRASAANYFDSSNNLVQATTNTARFDYGHSGVLPIGLLVEEARTNGVTNARGEGSTTGTLGSGGVNPTNWSAAAGTTADGLAISIVGSGTENGIPYVDWRFNGTAGGAGFSLAFTNNNEIAALQNQTWTHSLFYRLTAGSLTNVTLQMRLRSFSATPTALSTNDVAVTQPTSAALRTQRVSTTWTIPDATAAFIRGLLFVQTTAGAVDFTIRIGIPQMEQGGFMTSPILPAIGTPAATTRAIDVIAPLTYAANSNGGTIYAEYVFIGKGTPLQGSNIICVTGASSDTDFVQVGMAQATNNVSSSDFVGNVNKGATGSYSSTASIVHGTPTIHKTGVAYTTALIAYTLNGQAISSAVVNALPTLTKLQVFNTCHFQLGLSGYIRNVKYYASAIPPAALISLTT